VQSCWPSRVGRHAQGCCCSPGFGPERGGVFDCGRRLLLLALRLRTAGASLVTLVRMLMRMVVWLLPRCLCAAVLREGGYRRRQDEGTKTTPRNAPTAILVDFLILTLRNGRPNAVPGVRRQGRLASLRKNACAFAMMAQLTKRSSARHRRSGQQSAAPR
jgi:hypothetical protein